MSLYDDVVKTRDKLCEVAPKDTWERLNNDPWAVAVYIAETYYKMLFLAESPAPRYNGETKPAGEEKQLTEDEVQQMLYWFGAGCSWSYVAAALKTTKRSIWGALVQLGIGVSTVTDDDIDFSYDTYTAITGLYKSKGLTWLPTIYSEEEIYKTMLSYGYSVVDIYIAKYGTKDAMDSKDDLATFLHSDVDVAADYSTQTAQILIDWFRGRNTKFISRKHTISERSVRLLLAKCNYAIPMQGDDINIKMLQAAMVAYQNPGEFGATSSILEIANQIKAEPDVRYLAGDSLTLDDLDMLTVREMNEGVETSYDIARGLGVRESDVSKILERVYEKYPNT